MNIEDDKARAMSPATSSEERLVQWLRSWRHDPDRHGLANVDAKRTIYELLEGFISELLRYGPSSFREWWSDGVVHLEIREVTGEATVVVRMLGVTWITSAGLAPFEIEVEFDTRVETRFARTLFRIGVLDELRHPTTCSPTLAPTRILATRPRQDGDWAMAVELTPLGENGA